MIPSKRQLLKNLAKVFDLIALVASFVFAGIVAYSSLNGLTLVRIMAVRVTLGNCVLFTLLLITWHVTFTQCGLYVSKRFTKRRAEALEVFKATSLASAFLFLSARIRWKFQTYLGWYRCNTVRNLSSNTWCEYLLWFECYRWFQCTNESLCSRWVTNFELQVFF